MRDVVFWKDIVGKSFISQFESIAKAEYFAGKNETPMSKVVEKVNAEDYQMYRDKRELMRSHGWFQSYLSRTGELKFMSIYPIKERHYVSVSQYLAGKQADRIAADEEEYYRGQEALKKMIP